LLLPKAEKSATGSPQVSENVGPESSRESEKFQRSTGKIPEPGKK
jgi:hypothetical protein